MKYVNEKVVFMLSFIFLATFAAFMLGLISGRKEWAPSVIANDIVDATRSFYQTGKVIPQVAYSRRRGYAPDQRYILTAPNQVMPGYLAVTRMDASGPRYLVDLLDKDGNVVHSWPIDHSTLVEDGDKLEFSHAPKVMPDGSLLVSFNIAGVMARIDQCGNPLWIKADRYYHHVFQPDPNGLWTWQALVNPDGDDQKLFLFNPETGEELESVDLIGDVVGASPNNALITSIPDGYKFVRDVWTPGMTDIFHPNDIEPLPASMADAFPQFSAGDLLISLRNINLVGVLDRDTYEFLWAARGPWYQQHDPDWQPDGTITIFNNNLDRGRSSIVQVDPKTGAASVLFPDIGPRFYSHVMGNHQRLPNGNWLILSAMEGRVIEVTETGETVREYSNIINDTYNAIVSNVEFLPLDYFGKIPKCDLL